MANSLTMVYSKNNQLQNSVRGVLCLWLILELIVYRIGEMVKVRQGNGELLHNGENGLIAIYFFGIEQRCGNGELLNNSQFLCDRATASPTFYWLLSVQAFCIYGQFLNDCVTDRRDDQFWILCLCNRATARQWQTPRRWSIPKTTNSRIQLEAFYVSGRFLS
jgi:hypothetical protein